MRNPILAAPFAVVAVLALAALGSGCPGPTKDKATQGLACASRSNVSACTNGATPELALGIRSATACRDGCEAALGTAKVGAGCWVLAADGNCYCRSGAITSGGTRPGGLCGVTALACGARNDLSACTQGPTAQLDLGYLGATACRDQCEVQLPAHGVNATGCWVVAADGHCYCRSGGITTGGVQPGGACESPVPLSCSTVTVASTCSNGTHPEVDLGAIPAATCKNECQQWMGEGGMSSGCWVVAQDGHCYCRSGALSTGGSLSGGSCY